jgi:hypothetical protein
MHIDDTKLFFNTKNKMEQLSYFHIITRSFIWIYAEPWIRNIWVVVNFVTDEKEIIKLWTNNTHKNLEYVQAKHTEHVNNKQDFTKDLIIYYKQNQTILLTHPEK